MLHAAAMLLVTLAACDQVGVNGASDTSSLEDQPKVAHVLGQPLSYFEDQIARNRYFNVDEYPDVLWHNATTGESQAWFLVGSSRVARGTLTDNGQPLLRSAPWKVVGSRDFNGDFWADVAWYNEATGETQVWFMEETRYVGTAVIRYGNETIAYIGPPWRIVGVGDADGDGGSDLLWYNSATGESKFWLLDGTRLRRDVSIREGNVLATVGRPWSIVTANDFDGNGSADILWHNADTGESQIWNLKDQKISGKVTVRTLYGTPVRYRAPWRVAGSDDYDQDGDVDILWHNGSTGELRVWFMSAQRLDYYSTVDAYLDGGGANVALPWSIVSR